MGYGMSANPERDRFGILHCPFCDCRFVSTKDRSAHLEGFGRTRTEHLENLDRLRKQSVQYRGRWNKPKPQKTKEDKVKPKKKVNEWWKQRGGE